MMWENIKMAFLSLGNAKVRSFLTMLGIIIGVASVVAIVAIGQGVKDSVTKQVSGLGSDVLTITSGQTSTPGKGGNIAAALGTSTLTAADVASISKLKHITNASSMSLLSGILAHGTALASDSLVVATTPDFAKIVDQPLASGRFLTEADSTANVIVLGDKTKTDLFGTADATGKLVTFRGTPLTVVGVVKKKDTGGSIGPSQDAIAYISKGTAKALTGTDPSILRIYAKVDSATTVGTAVGQINGAVKKNHGGQSDFTVQTQADLLSTFNTILNLLTTFIAAIASISLLVGGIGIMNIMLVNVTERTREIGLRKALGASSSTVLSQFLIEAVVISVIGGALGIVVAIGMATLAGKLAGITPAFTVNSMLIAVGVSAGVGIIFGIAPAIKAARKRPIQALKAE
jgi:putative ABC transport system permease protein